VEHKRWRRREWLGRRERDARSSVSRTSEYLCMLDTNRYAISPRCCFHAVRSGVPRNPGFRARGTDTPCAMARHATQPTKTSRNSSWHHECTMSE
jgi:hypothetical protein